MHGPNHVLPADGTLAHPLAALGARDHVTALQQHAVDHGIHADTAQVVVLAGQPGLVDICRGGRENKQQMGVGWTI